MLPSPDAGRLTCDNGTVTFKRRNLEALADLIVGNAGRDDAKDEDEAKYFPYWCSMYITDFLQELGTEYQHDGSTRHPPKMFCRLIDQLMSPGRSAQRRIRSSSGARASQ